MSRKFSNRVVESMFLALLPAQMFAIAVQNLNGLLNSMIVGNMMGEECLSVFGFIWPLMQIHSMLSGGVAIGSQILCGRFVGRGDHKGVGGIYTAVSVLCIVIGAIMTAVYIVFPVQVAEMLGATGNALNYTADYLRGCSWSMILMMFATSMIPFLQLNNARNVMYIAISALTVVNIGGDLISIKVFNAGMTGIGNAVSFGYLAFILVVFIYYISPKCGVRLNVHSFSLRRMAEIIRLGLPEMLMCMCIAARTLILNKIALSLAGNLAMSAVAVITNLCSLMDVITRGIEGTTNMEASLLYGERDKNSLRELAPIITRISIPLKVGGYLVICAGASLLARIFGVTSADVPFTAHAIRLFMLYPVTNLLFAIIANTYKGMGKTALTSVIVVFNFFIVPALLMLTLPKLFGIDGLWLCTSLEEVFTTIGLIVYCAIRRGAFPKRMNEIIYIPEEFGVDSKDRFDASVQSENQLTEVSQRAIEFCREKGMNGTRSNFCGLCVEEMCAAILEHGRESAKQKRGKYEIDLRMIYENEGVSMMIRDNYPPFNPLEWANLQNPEDPARFIGVRMVTGMAQTISYDATINLNILKLRLEIQP